MIAAHVDLSRQIPYSTEAGGLARLSDGWGGTRGRTAWPENEKALISQGLKRVVGGEGGIRTPDALAGMPHFECGAFNRSATSPRGPR